MLPRESKQHKHRSAIINLLFQHHRDRPHGPNLWDFRIPSQHSSQCHLKVSKKKRGSRRRLHQPSLALRATQKPGNNVRLLCKCYYHSSLASLSLGCVPRQHFANLVLIVSHGSFQQPGERKKTQLPTSAPGGGSLHMGVFLLREDC